MINLILSLILAASGWAATLLIFDSFWAGILPFVIILPLSLFLLSRRINKKFMAISQRAQDAMQSLPALKSEEARKNVLDKAVAIFKQGYALKHFQFYLAAQLNAQIGTLYYIQKRFKEAEPYLANAFFQQGTAIAMYACILYKRKDYDAMAKQFERAVKYSKKVPMLWNLYAWCLLQIKKRDEAIAVLNRCLTNTPNDQTTLANLDLVKNSAKIKMRGYNEQWYQFHLDTPPPQKVAYDKRSMYRGH